MSKRIYAQRFCEQCGGAIHRDRHKNNFCSLKCEKTAETFENVTVEETILIDYAEKGYDNLRALCVGDVHFPFEKAEVLEEIFKAAKELKPNFIIQMGDMYDMHAQSKFPRTHNLYTPLQETKLARTKAEKFWARMRKEHPKAQLVQLRGNHSARPFKRMLETCPELEPFMDVTSMWEFEGVHTHHSTRDPFVAYGICWEHGHTSHGKHALHNMMPTVCGHTHRGGVMNFNIRNRQFWELNAGYCGDPSSVPLGYTPRQWVNWTHGYGWVDKFGPRYTPITVSK